MRISDWSSDVCSSDLKVRFGGYECERGAALGLLPRANSRIGKGRLASRSRIDWRKTWCGESVHRSVEREVDVGCEALMLGSHQRPGSSQPVVILGIDGRVGARKRDRWGQRWDVRVYFGDREVIKKK